jgi:hypothetical protein
MPRFRIITLVDITRTDPGREETDQKKISQQSNFNSLLQSIGLRSNVSWDLDPQQHQGRLPAPADGKHTHWIWDFDIEREDTFLKDGDPTGLLLDDLHGVPIIDGLNNTAIIDPAVFQTRGPKINIWIHEFQGQ